MPGVRPLRAVLPCLAALAALGAPAGAQTLQQLREELRQEIGTTGFGQSIAGLLDITNERELSTGRYAVDDAQRTRIEVIGLPWSKRLFVGGEDGVVVRLAAGLAWMQANASRDQWLDDPAPGETFGYDARWTAWSALLGAGLELPIAEGLTFTPIADVSLSYVESEAGYRGTAVETYAPVVDGILFNWRATTLGAGTAMRMVYAGDLAARTDYELVLRYDVRNLETVHSTDPAQDFDEINRFLTARLTFDGPTGLSLGSLPVFWTTHVGYRRFFSQTAQALGFEDFVELGGSLELAGLAFPSSVTLSASILRGRDVEGWTAGLSVSL